MSLVLDRSMHQVLEKDYLKQTILDAQVAHLDPLNADHIFAVLPEINQTNGSVLLLNYMVELVNQARLIETPSQAIALACLRDLGILASCLTKVKIEVSTVPFLEDVLANFGQWAGEVPRDTIFSYAPRNPSGERMRRFTNLPEEALFVESLKSAMQHLDRCVHSIHQASTLSIFAPDFARFVNEGSQTVQIMIEAIMRVKETIQAEVFSYQIRPYFEPYMVKGLAYTASNASSMPVSIIDRLIWADKVEDQSYREYYQHTLQYMPFSYRAFADRIDSSPSLISRIFAEMSHTELNHTALQSIESVETCLTTILRFRCPHKRVVDDNFKLRGEGAVGSGGLSPSFLDYLIQQNFQIMKQLKNLQHNFYGAKRVDSNWVEERNPPVSASKVTDAAQPSKCPFKRMTQFMSKWPNPHA